MGRRFFRHGELHLVILVLLSGRALHGYELMRELAGLFGPAYRPSPGSVYPAVKALAQEGLIVPGSDGERTRYSATESGRQAVTARRTELTRLEERTGVRLGTDVELERSLDRFTARVRALAGRVDASRLSREIDAATDELDDLDPRSTKD